MDLATLNSTLRRVPSWLLYICGLAPAVWLFWQGLTGGLGVEPIKALEHRYGELALQFFIASLAVTPMRRFLGVAKELDLVFLQNSLTSGIAPGSSASLSRRS